MHSIISLRSNITRRKANITEAHFLTECASRSTLFLLPAKTHLQRYRISGTACARRLQFGKKLAFFRIKFLLRDYAAVFKLGQLFDVFQNVVL